jgi:hypothetical protein
VEGLAGDRGVEVPVEVFEGLEVAEGGGLDAACQQALVADGEFVGEEEFEEVGVAEAVAGGFLESDVEGVGEARETQSPEGIRDGAIHRGGFLLSSGLEVRGRGGSGVPARRTGLRGRATRAPGPAAVERGRPGLHPGRLFSHPRSWPLMR